MHFLPWAHWNWSAEGNHNHSFGRPEWRGRILKNTAKTEFLKIASQSAFLKSISPASHVNEQSSSSEPSLQSSSPSQKWMWWTHSILFLQGLEWKAHWMGSEALGAACTDVVPVFFSIPSASRSSEESKPIALTGMQQKFEAVVQIKSAYHSWPHLCHPDSPTLHRRGTLQASIDFCYHSGEHSCPFASYSPAHQSGPGTEGCHHTPGPGQYTSSHEHTGTGLYWMNFSMRMMGRPVYFCCICSVVYRLYWLQLGCKPESIKINVWN